MNSDIVSLIIILICVMLSAYFSATETSFTSLNRIRMKNMAEKGDKRAELVLKLLENFDKLLSTILVGNNIVNIGLSSLATVLFIKLLGGDSGARTSSPVRLKREENFECTQLAGLYPCGEGAGYAGGIMSAAVDGLRVARAIISRYAPAEG